MRLPLVRSGTDGPPIAWWEWLFAPLMMLLTLLLLPFLMCVGVVYFTLYPERHVHVYDVGT